MINATRNMIACMFLNLMDPELAIFRLFEKSSDVMTGKGSPGESQGSTWLMADIELEQPVL